MAEQFSLRIASKAWSRTVCLLRAGYSSCRKQIGNSLAQNPVIGNTEGVYGFVFTPGGAAPRYPSFLNYSVLTLNSITCTQNADTSETSSKGSCCVWEQTSGCGTIMSMNLDAHQGARTCSWQRPFFVFQNSFNASITRFLLLVVTRMCLGPICIARSAHNMSLVV